MIKEQGEKHHKRAAFTIVNNAYLHFAMTLSESFAIHNSDYDFYIFLIDDKPRGIELNKKVQIIEVSDDIVDDLRHRAFYYEITELSTSIKPNAMLHLLSMGYLQVSYIDPDINFYRPITEVENILEEYNIVITPHAMTPIYDGSAPSDLTFMQVGAYNLGFIAVRNHPEVIRFLNWWSHRLSFNAFSAFSKGMFTDQKWIDLIISYFDGVFVFKNFGYNVAYWNLHERTVEKRFGRYYSNSHPLVFFHFSGISLHDDHLSKYQSRFRSSMNIDLDILFYEYRKNLICNLDLLSHISSKYKYGYFCDGNIILDSERLLYFYKYISEEIDINPQSLTRKEFYNFLQQSSKKEPAPMRKFSRDLGIEEISLKIYRMPRLFKWVGRQIVRNTPYNRIMKLTNNQFNKLNITRIIYALFATNERS
jgi:hypothetical protein